MIRKPSRLLVVIVLGVLAVGLNVTYWKAWRAGPLHGEPIMGLMGRHGVTAADPMNALLVMTVLVSAAFFVSAMAFFPGLSGWIRRQRWECWKCQQMRPPESEA